jgi:hypothetical protein
MSAPPGHPPLLLLSKSFVPLASLAAATDPGSPAAGARRLNPIQSAKYQLERLLGAGMAHLNLGPGPQPPSQAASGPGCMAAEVAAAAARPLPASLSRGGESASGTSGGGGFSTASSQLPGRVYSYRELWDATQGFNGCGLLRGGAAGAAPGGRAGEPGLDAVYGAHVVCWGGVGRMEPSASS